MANIKSVMQDVDLLKSDIGPFEETSEEWSAMSIVLKQYGARLMVASIDQSVRGLLFKQYRPDLIILDDTEDIASVKTQEARNKLYEWFTGDIVPLGDLHTRIILLGTRIHKDDLPSRLINQIKEKKRDGVYIEIPIIENGQITWLGKYADLDAIEEEKRKVGNRFSWEREYMLNPLSPEEQLFKPEWITFYNKLPSFENLSSIIVGVDLAIKETETSDYTAMVIVYVFGEGQDSRFYIGKPIINRRLSLHGMATTANQIYLNLPREYLITFVVEDVGYQLAAVQELEEKGIPVEGTKVHGQDKYTRASIVSTLFERNRVHFPESNAENFISQLTGFPNDSHDDMVDALVYALLKSLELDSQDPQLFIYDL